MCSNILELDFEYIIPVSEKNIKDLDLVIFTGGEDVCPVLYGKENKYSGYNIERDQVDLFNLTMSLYYHKKIFGVCRGHQFINILLGGKIYQDTYREANVIHDFIHPVENVNNNLIHTNLKCVNSTHHQGIYEVGNNFTILNKYNGIVESALSNDFKIFTVQYHPEFKDFPKDSFEDFSRIFKIWMKT